MVWERAAFKWVQLAAVMRVSEWLKDRGRGRQARAALVSWRSHRGTGAFGAHGFPANLNRFPSCSIDGVERYNHGPTEAGFHTTHFPQPLPQRAGTSGAWIQGNE